MPAPLQPQEDDMTRQSLPHLLEAGLGRAELAIGLRREFDEMLDRMSRGFGTDLRPDIDVRTTDDAIEITAEMPGISRDAIDVSVDGELLMLSGRKEQEKRTEEGGAILTERRYGSFARRIPLGFVPSEDGVSARLSDGVLTLRVAKPAEAAATRRKIDVEPA
jgi:HSP20 family protein